MPIWEYPLLLSPNLGFRIIVTCFSVLCLCLCKVLVRAERIKNTISEIRH
jgi:hypothetical protein